MDTWSCGTAPLAAVRSVAVPAQVTTGLLVLPSLAEATSALPGVVETGFAAAELLDARSLTVAQDLPGSPAEIGALRIDGRSEERRVGNTGRRAGAAEAVRR